MARTLSEILRRFRPAVAPGPAGPAGVPADRVAEAAAELAGVFAALEPTVRAARQVREDARVAADRRRQEAAAEADRIVAQARSRLGAVRAEAASARLATADEERVALEREARAEADRVWRVGEESSAAIVAKVVEAVWATGGVPADRSPGARSGEAVG